MDEEGRKPTLAGFPPSSKDFTRSLGNPDTATPLPLTSPQLRPAPTLWFGLHGAPAPQSALSPDHSSPQLPPHRPAGPHPYSPDSACISLSWANITAPNSRNLAPEHTPSLALLLRTPPCVGIQGLLCHECQPCVLRAQALPSL